MIKFSRIPQVLLIIATASCKKYPAPIVDNSSYVYTKSASSKYSKPRTTKIISSNSNKYIKVKAGDNLYKISKQHNASIKDIIDSNNLSPPFNLAVGKKLRIPSKKFHIVQKGENLYEISRSYSLNMNQLVSLNNLKEPYRIKEGQKLAITIDGTTPIKQSTLKKKSSRPRVHNAKINNQKKSKLAAKANLSWPIHGRVISSFGPKKGGLYNDGINIKTRSGSPIKSAQSGTVAYVGSELKGYGNLIIIKHNNKIITAYGHLERSLVQRGQKVKKQQVIAYAGSSGNVDTSQLYFGLRNGKSAINPQYYLKN